MNVFDIVGPVMIGPSSSHTAGAVKIGYFCHLLSEGVKDFEITFYGSFAKTYKGHCTDRALIGGIMGYGTDDVRIRKSLIDSVENGYNINIIESDEVMGHPNTAKIKWVSNGHVFEVIGWSVGGGNIKIVQICDQKTAITTSEEYVLVDDDFNNLITNYTFKSTNSDGKTCVLVNKKDIDLEMLIANNMTYFDFKTKEHYGKI